MLILDGVSLSVVVRVWVLHYHIVLRQSFDIRHHSCRDVAIGNSVPVPGSSSLHLVESRVVCSVNSIPSVDIRRDEVSVTLILLESVGLMCACMCSKQCGFIDVVCIGKGPARVVGWEAE